VKTVLDGRKMLRIASLYAVVLCALLGKAYNTYQNATYDEEGVLLLAILLIEIQFEAVRLAEMSPLPLSSRDRRTCTNSVVVFRATWRYMINNAVVNGGCS
jgi:hypothetical protein